MQKLDTIMDFCRFTTFTWIISIALLLGCQRLCAQQYYIDPAKYSLIPGEPPYKALSFENPHQDFDWEVDSLPRRTLFAVKTNLLFNAVTALNVELEIPIGDRYSIAGEWIFPWWLSDSRQRCFELLCGTVEGRRWLGDRTGVEQLTGWAVGLYAGCGYYDFEWDGTGYQGENVIAGGISAAYAHSIGENLRLEYSLGVGLLTTKYRKYKAQQCGDDWNLKLTERSTKHFFGPTRCRISLAWMLHRADKRGGKR